MIEVCLDRRIQCPQTGGLSTYTHAHTHTHTHGSKTQHVLCVHSNHTYICTYSHTAHHTRTNTRKHTHPYTTETSTLPATHVQTHKNTHTHIQQKQARCPPHINTRRTHHTHTHATTPCRASLTAQAVQNLPAVRGPVRSFDPCVAKIPWKRKWQSTPALLPGESHAYRSLAGCSP